MWIIAALTGTFAVVLIPAFLGRRLLGIDAGPLRLVVAGIVGISVSGALLGSQLQNADRRNTMLSLMIGIGLIVAMVTLVSLRELLPPGSGPLDLVRGIRGRISRGRRYSHIARIAGRHGLGPYLRGRRAVESDGTPPSGPRAGAGAGVTGRRGHLREARPAEIEPGGICCPSPIWRS